MTKGGYIYIVTNKNRTTLYIGVTSHLQARIYEHKSGHGSAFTKQYNCTELIYYEVFDDIESAIVREKQLKKWRREFKNNIISEFNPEWRGSYDEILDYN